MRTNDADVLTEASQKACGGVVIVGEVVATAGVQRELEVLEVEGEIKDSLVVGRECSLLQGCCNGGDGQEEDVEEHFGH